MIKLRKFVLVEALKFLNTYQIGTGMIYKTDVELPFLIPNMLSCRHRLEYAADVFLLKVTREAGFRLCF